ncbi:MAG TPA: DUF5701 family protein [Ornithinibacter sp.]|jgi:hypothetical protein|nr:DUF5701 family protein [Ornithinibacter sp.]HOB79081.1 DUF5701 family protein [Ornithinibacter sp.]HPV88916.1 DUF5701 family protein [Ornithinibacter sp.]HQA13453.1 DUF5701 family protein [Ornithinibacter sp.]HQD68323.1 DUF5701 family protein [Ornithinibacter sp.]
MTASQHLQRLLDLGLADLTAVSDATLARHASALPHTPNTTLAIHPSLASPRQLAPLLSRTGKEGFVVEDLTDLEQFTDVEGLAVPDAPLYLLHDIDRGDDLRNWSPNEALSEITARGRTPLTLNEGISWLLQEPEHLLPGSCFMTIGTRKRTAKGLDTRTPALWISGGTGRDGKERKGAPKVGWCWAGNRHTWLGFASATGRSA